MKHFAYKDEAMFLTRWSYTTLPSPSGKQEIEHCKQGEATYNLGVAEHWRSCKLDFAVRRELRQLSEYSTICLKTGHSLTK